MLAICICTIALGGSGSPLVDAPRERDTLDRELDALSVTLQADTPSVSLDAFLRVVVSASDNVPIPFTNQFIDVLGTSIANARVGVSGEFGKYSLRIDTEAAGGTPQLLNGYAAWECNEHLRTTMGRFQTPLGWSTLLNPRDQFFILRTNSDEFWIGGAPTQFANDIGLMLDGSVERLHWWAAAQNGVDGLQNEVALTGRVRYDVLGAGVGLLEGSYGVTSGEALSVEAAWHDDGGPNSDADALSLGAQYANADWSANAQLFDYGKGTSFTAPDSTPWAVALTYMLERNTWEVGARYQSEDNATDLSALTLGVNYYVVGHAVKWQCNLVQTMSDDPDEERTAFGLSLVVGV